LLRLADSLGVKASYEGVLSDSELRSRVFGGRTVMVVPSRADAFNYVALEAILNGCPLVLSNRTGAYGFLRDEHPRLLPAIMDPDDIPSAAESLNNILCRYPEIARELRRELIERPFPAPKTGFMEPVYNCPRAGQAMHGQEVGKDASARCASIPLRNPAAFAWRELRRSKSPRVTVVIPTFNRPELLAPTLACLTRQTLADIEVLILDDGSADELRVRSVAEAFAPMVRLIRKGNSGEASTVNRGIDEARGEFVGFLSDDDVYDPDLLETSVAALNRNPRAIGTYPDWDIIDVAGQFVEEHKVPDFSREKMLVEHWCLPGPGAVIRREVLLKIGGRDTSFRFVSDFDLWLRATKYGPMIHLPRKLAYWRLHTSNLTSSEQRTLMARERLRLIEKFFRDPEEQWQPDVVRRAYASAHLAAAAILGRAEPRELPRWLRCAEKLAPGCSTNLPANMAGYRALWRETEEAEPRGGGRIP
jgi:GT2 family glycosyltransferase